MSPAASHRRKRGGAKHFKKEESFGKKLEPIKRSPNEELFESIGLGDVLMMAESTIEGLRPRDTRWMRVSEVCSNIWAKRVITQYKLEVKLSIFQV